MFLNGRKREFYWLVVMVTNCQPIVETPEWENPIVETPEWENPIVETPEWENRAPEWPVMPDQLPSAEGPAERDRRR